MGSKKRLSDNMGLHFGDFPTSGGGTPPHPSYVKITLLTLYNVLPQWGAIDKRYITFISFLFTGLVEFGSVRAEILLVSLERGVQILYLLSSGDPFF